MLSSRPVHPVGVPLTVVHICIIVGHCEADHIVSGETPHPEISMFLISMIFLAVKLPILNGPIGDI